MTKYSNTLFFFTMHIFCISFFFASEVDIPDFETKINKTGNSVPENAIPNLKSPDPVFVPVVLIGDNTENQKNLQPTENADVDLVQDIADSYDSLVSKNVPLPFEIHGFALFGLGFPETLLGEVMVERSANDITVLPFSAGFSWASHDRYNFASPGSGFFDRSAEFSFTIDTKQNEQPELWLYVQDRMDGLQGFNKNYFSVSNTLVRWDVIPLSGKEMPLAQGDFQYKLVFSGDVASVSGDKVLQDVLEEFVIPYSSSFSLKPQIEFLWRRGIVTMSLGGFYEYSSITAVNDVHFGGAFIDVDLGFNIFKLGLSAGLSSDSLEGLITPFDISFAGEVGTQDILAFEFAAGLVADKTSPYDALGTEPFSSLDRSSYIFADWFGLGNVELRFGDFKISTLVDWRSTINNRGVYMITGPQLQNGLIDQIRVSRDALTTDFMFGWMGSHVGFTAGYQGLWIQSFSIEPKQSVQFGFSMFDSNSDSNWNFNTRFALYFDKVQIPNLTFKGSVYLAKDFLLSLSWDDCIPLLMQKQRLRNNVYSVSSSLVMVSITLKF